MNRQDAASVFRRLTSTSIADAVRAEGDRLDAEIARPRREKAETPTRREEVMSDWQDTRLALEEARAELDRERNENRSNLELVVEIERLRAALAEAKRETDASESVLQKLRDLRIEDNERLHRFIARYERAEADLEAAREVIKGLLSEWDRLTRYGSPMAKAANERITAARAFLERNAPKS